MTPGPNKVVGPRQLASEDEILEVDGKIVEAQDVPSAIVGADVVNSSVKLLVRKADTGRQVEVRAPARPQRDRHRLLACISQYIPACMRMHMCKLCDMVHK